MTKLEKIKYLVSEYAKSFGINSDGWKYFYIHQDSIVNRINRNWYKEMIDILYDGYKSGLKKIEKVYDILSCL